MQMHPFRFGVTSYGASSGEEWVKKSQRVEELGYSSLFVSDHFMGQVSVIPALAFAAASTTRLRVGSIVCANDFRHPILLAKEAATIDLFSNGRLELGIGASYLKAEYDALGISFDDASTRIERLRESLQLIKAYFRGEIIDFTGKHYRIQSELGLDHIPALVQKPSPPIIIGGGGKRMLTLAGQEADIIGLAMQVNKDGTGPDTESALLPLEQKIEWVRSAAGARFDNLEINVQTWVVAVTDHRKETLEQIGQQFPLPYETLASLPFLLVGTVEEIIEQIQSHRKRYGISYFLVFDQYMEQFTPVVSELAGK
jgi:probable F420-dependent oxidoreductase